MSAIGVTLHAHSFADDYVELTAALDRLDIGWWVAKGTEEGERFALRLSGREALELARSLDVVLEGFTDTREGGADG